MQYFKIAYDDVKKLTRVFYSAPYEVGVSFVDMLHNLKVASDTEDKSFKQFFDEEKAEELQNPPEVK